MRKMRDDGNGRVTLPAIIRKETGIYPGDEVTLEKTEKGVLIKPVVSNEVFLQSLEGCITENNQAEMVDPRDLKKIWGSIHAHD